LNDLDEPLIRALAGGLPRDLHPYRRLAESLGVDEAAVLGRLGAMLADGRLRRIAAVADQRRLGLAGNALAAWDVAEEATEAFGRALAARAETTHVYQRRRAPGWPYNMYSMIHAADEAKVRALAEAWAAQLRPRRYRLLVTVREWKKSPAVYYQCPKPGTPSS
jgi:DNA-binding Lrp family transcriptional regulator